MIYALGIVSFCWLITLLVLAVNWPSHRRMYFKLIRGEFSAEKNHALNILNYYPTAIVILDQDSVIRCFNREAEELTGYRAYESIGKNYESVFKSPAPAIEHYDFHSMRHVSKIIKGAKGQDLRIIESVRILEDSHENQLGLLLSFDVAHSRLDLDSQLKLIQSISEKIVEYANIGILILDRNRNIILVNEYFLQLFNMQRIAVIGKHIKNILPQLDDLVSHVPPDVQDLEFGQMDLITTYGQTIPIEVECVVERQDKLALGYGFSLVYSHPVAETASEAVSTTPVSQQDTAKESHSEVPQLALSLNYFKSSDFIKQMFYKLQDLVLDKKLKVTSTLLKSDAVLYADKSKIERVIFFLSGRIMNATGSEYFHLSFTQRESGDAMLVTVENLEVNIPEVKRKQLEMMFDSGDTVAQRVVKEHHGRLWIDLEQGLSFKFTIPFASTVKYAGLKVRAIK